MPQYIDIHSHLTMYEPDELPGVLERMRESDTQTITIGTTIDNSREARALAREHDGVFACAGVHPDEVKTGGEIDETFADLVADPSVVAVGECGFDYFRSDRNEVKEKQEKVFEAQIEQAITHEKPLMLHIRPTRETADAYDDALEVLEHHSQKAGEKLTGNAHFFAGSIDQIKRFLNIGFTISFTGVITFTDDYHERIQFVPQDMLHAETDAPFVAPEPYRGKQNEPSYVQYVVEKLAEIRGESPDKLKSALQQNAARVFGLGD